MASFVEIQNAVKGRIIDLPSYVASDVPRLVNRAVRAIQAKHNFKVMETLTSANTDTTAGDSGRVLTTLPTNFKEWRGNPYWVDNDGRVKNMVIYTERSDVTRRFGVDTSTDIGEPEGLLISEPDDDRVANIEVWPLPDGLSQWSDGEYRIYIPYYRFLPLLSSDSDSNWITDSDQGEEYTIAQATADAFPIDWDEERAAIWSQIAANKRRGCIIEDKQLRLSATDTLRMGVNAKER